MQCCYTFSNVYVSYTIIVKNQLQYNVVIHVYKHHPFEFDIVNRYK